MAVNKVDFRLLVISDRKLTDNLLSVVKRCCAGGVKAIQLREKDMLAGELVKLANDVKTLTLVTQTKLIINDRIDIALLSKADGLHVSGGGIEMKYIKKYKGLLKGKSVHSVKEAKIAEKEGYDYLLFGPVFRTPAKIRYGSPQGLKNLESVCSSANIPVFAVGGITPRRVKKCLNAGAYGVAVIRAIMISKNVKQTIAEFKTELGGL